MTVIIMPLMVTAVVPFVSDAQLDDVRKLRAKWYMTLNDAWVRHTMAPSTSSMTEKK